MRRTVCKSRVALVWGMAAAVGGRALSAGPDAWWESRIAAIAAGPGASAGEGGTPRVEKVGESTGGRALTAVWIGEAGGKSGGARVPTIAVVAGLDGRHTVGTRVALGLIEKLAAERPRELSGAAVVVLACANPDGMTAFDGAGVKADDGTNGARRRSARDDADRDRRMDEDGGADLNGDGVITTMRIKNPRQGLVRGAAADQVAEADEARLLRRADAGKGERGEWAVLAEGRDEDGDGLIAEDGARGVDLDSNFPFHWPEFDDRAGPTPLSEPESRAIAEWLMGHPEVVVVVEYGPNDNLVGLPANGKMDETGQSPISNGVLDEDKPLYERVSGKFKELTKITGVGGLSRSFDGSLQGWAYAQLGVASFVTPVWVRPDLLKQEEKKEEDKPKEGEPPRKKVVDSDDGKWLAVSDQRIAAGQATGFVEWSPFKHPQLGEVEIGGWVPGFKFNPPESEWARLVDEQFAFVRAVAEMLPRLSVEGPSVERVGQRAWRVRASAVNGGSMPTRLGMGVRARRHPDTRWALEVDAARVVSGSRVQGAGRVTGSGGRLDGEWVVAGSPGDEIRLRLLSPECGDREVSVKLEGEVKP